MELAYVTEPMEAEGWISPEAKFYVNHLNKITHYQTCIEILVHIIGYEREYLSTLEIMEAEAILIQRGWIRFDVQETFLPPIDDISPEAYEFLFDQIEAAEYECDLIDFGYLYTRWKQWNQSVLIERAILGGIYDSKD